MRLMIEPILYRLYNIGVPNTTAPNRDEWDLRSTVETDMIKELEPEFGATDENHQNFGPICGFLLKTIFSKIYFAVSSCLFCYLQFLNKMPSTVGALWRITCAKYYNIDNVWRANCLFIDFIANSSIFWYNRYPIKNYSICAP